MWWKSDFTPSSSRRQPVASSSMMAVRTVARFFKVVSVIPDPPLQEAPLRYPAFVIHGHDSVIAAAQPLPVVLSRRCHHVPLTMRERVR
jgi:hypothetical protein